MPVRSCAAPVLLSMLAAMAVAGSNSIWDGVYSNEQAARGQTAYNSKCARCHGDTLLGGESAPALVDQDFLEKWNGKSVGALVELTRKTMPSDGPGKVSRQECTDIIAYLLKSNGFPAGKTDLAPGIAIQNDILIEPKR